MKTLYFFLFLPLITFAQETPVTPAPDLAPVPVPVVAASIPSISVSDLETLDRDTAFDSMMAALDLQSGNYVFENKTSGTSLGMKIKKAAGGKIGKWLPTNESANPEGQVVAYRLGRFLQMSSIVIPSDYYTLRGQPLDQFYRMISSRSERNQIRYNNQVRLMDAYRRNSSEMFGAISAPIDQFEVANLIIAESNTIDSSHPIANYIQAGSSMPGDRQMSLNGRRNKAGKVGTNSALNLSREFSKIMVLDILTGQYDRWSGGNVEEFFDKDGVVHFISRDNGGSSMVGSGPLSKYFGIVSRFDRGQIARVRKLAEALQKSSGDVSKVLLMRSSTKALALRLQALLNHVENTTRRYGEERAFFPN